MRAMLNQLYFLAERQEIKGRQSSLSVYINVTALYILDGRQHKQILQNYMKIITITQGGKRD